MTHLLPVRFSINITLWLLLTSSEASAGSLYRCVTDTGGTVYTDNPAQLEQCVPITASGAVTSLATVSSVNPPIGSLLDPPPMTSALPESTTMIPPPSSSDQAIAGVPQNADPTTPPCPVGINPLNPLSAPPCPTDEAVPPAASGMPPAPGSAPAVPSQP